MAALMRDIVQQYLQSHPSRLLLSATSYIYGSTLHHISLEQQNAFRDCAYSGQCDLALTGSLYAQHMLENMRENGRTV